MAEGRCYICGAYGQVDKHHCLHGIRRKAADKYGLTVNLCRTCHRKLHDKALTRYEQDFPGEPRWTGN